MLEREEISLENDKFESKMNPRFLPEEVVEMGCVEVRESDGLMILEVYFGSKSNKNKFSFRRIKGEVVR